MARLEDILYLVFWNGYAEDCRQAVYISKETITDERIWFPFLIHITYGPKNKTILHIMAEHSTPVGNRTKRKLIIKKGGAIIYRDENHWLARVKQLEQMASDTNHAKLFENILVTPDINGTTPLISACINNCPKIVSYLLKRGVDYNQKDDSGKTPSYYASNSKYGQQAWDRLLTLSNFKAEYSYGGISF